MNIDKYSLLKKSGEPLLAIAGFLLGTIPTYYFFYEISLYIFECIYGMKRVLYKCSIIITFVFKLV